MLCDLTNEDCMRSSYEMMYSFSFLNGRMLLVLLMTPIMSNEGYICSNHKVMAFIICFLLMGCPALFRSCHVLFYRTPTIDKRSGWIILRGIKLNLSLLIMFTSKKKPCHMMLQQYEASRGDDGLRFFRLFCSELFILLKQRCSL